MRKKQILLFLLLLAPFVAQPVFATQLWLDPSGQIYSHGSSLAVDIMADIDEPDAVFGFGFDLSFNNGATYVPGPGSMGSYLTYTGFAVNAALFDDPFPPFWDDGDGIAGAVDLFSPEVWGTNLLLGTFSFTAPAAGTLGIETIYLGPVASDYGIFGVEGLIGNTALMPNNPTASFTPRVDPVPEPATMLLLGTGVAGLFGYRRKRKK